MKLVEDHDGNTFRVGYTVVFPEAVYVLHVFKKESSSGVSTPQPDKNLLRRRLQAAQQHYRSHYGHQ